MCRAAAVRGSFVSTRTAEPLPGDINSGSPGPGVQAAKRLFEIGGDRDRDPFPLPVPKAGFRSMQHASDRRGCRSRAEVGKDIRVAEAARSLKALSSASAAAARHDTWQVHSHSKTGSGHGPTLAQRSILDGMRDRIEAYGAPPEDLSGQQALHSLLKSDDSYVLGAKNLAPYQPDLLKVAKSDVLPKKATELLPLDTSKFLLHPDKFIIRSDSEMSEWRSCHPSFRPYWDPTLAGCWVGRLCLYVLHCGFGHCEYVLAKPRDARDP